MGADDTNYAHSFLNLGRLSSANYLDLADNNPTSMDRWKWGFRVKNEKEVKTKRQEREAKRHSQ